MNTYTPHTKDQAMILMMATLGTDAQPTAAMAAGVRTARTTWLPCQECGESHWASNLDGSTGLCEDCYDLAGMENEHSDGHHDGAPNRDCPDCLAETPAPTRAEEYQARAAYNLDDHEACDERAILEGLPREMWNSAVQASARYAQEINRLVAQKEEF